MRARASAADADMSAVFDTLDEEEKKVVESVIRGVDVTEIYSPARVNRLAAKMGLIPGHSLDLTNGWDFSREEHRRKAWNLIKSTKPYMLIGSPPCTMFSMLQELNLHIHRHDDEWLRGFDERWNAAVQHIDFCVRLYRHQLSEGRHFIHEHPRDAKSWNVESMRDLLRDQRVTWVEGHMCQFGMTAPISGSGGEVGYAKKPTGFLSSSRHVAEELNRYCDGSHDHVHLVAGKAAAAQVYPPKLCTAILKGTAKQKREDESNLVTTASMTLSKTRSFIDSLSSVCMGSLSDMIENVVHDGKVPSHWVDCVHEEDGGSDCRGIRPQSGIEVLREELDALTFKNGIAIAKDDVTGTELVPKLVQSARDEEIAYFMKRGVYDVVPRGHEWTTGGKVIGTRWVDTNKGDADVPDCRSRLVGREFNVGRDDNLYAATPPLEALRWVLSCAATWPRGRSGKRRCVMINDVRRAYFYAKIQRDVYIEVPREDSRAGPDVIGKLKLCLYGTRDAAKGWQEELSQQLEQIGFVRGVGHPSVFSHPDRQICTIVHGDDYVSSGLDSDLRWLESELAKSYEIKTQLLGLDKGWERQGKVLNRIVSCSEEGWTIEADPRHAELIVEQLGVEDTRAVVSPGIDGAEEEDNDEDVDIVGADLTRFRGVAARCNYLSFDRPDAQYATKEICREMSKPTTGSLRRLRRIGCYLKGARRLVWDFKMQDEVDTIDVYTDSDWAGCRRSRKSTSGGAIMRGSHCLKAWSKTQALIAKSSGEAELYAVVRGATEAMGMVTLAKDLGTKVQIQLHIDALAAKGMIERKGLSKVRHLDVNVLWLQEQCARKILPVAKVPGEENPADLMTKHLGAAKIAMNIKTLSMRMVDGRAGKAAQLHQLASHGHVLWDAMSDRLTDKRGGDNWKSKGEAGIWHRIHTKPRRALFTPFKVAKGPASNENLSVIRFTKGVSQSGHKFEFHDKWQESRNSHRLLDELWVGCTTFVVEDRASLLAVQQGRRDAGVPGAEDVRPAAGAALRWSDILSE